VALVTRGRTVYIVGAGNLAGQASGASAFDGASLL
jgi:hypothetical protein